MTVPLTEWGKRPLQPFGRESQNEADLALAIEQKRTKRYFFPGRRSEGLDWWGGKEKNRVPDAEVDRDRSNPAGRELDEDE